MRRIRTLALGAVVALGLLAVPAGASAASGFEADKPAALQGSSTGFTLVTNVGEQSCTSPNLASEGTVSAASSLTMQVSNSTCSFFGSNPALKMNGCKFIFRPGTKAGESFNGSYDIGPPGCGPITYKYLDCTVSIGAQTGLAATYQNTGSGNKATVKITSGASGIVYTETGSFCEKQGASSNGQYKGTWTVSGNSSGTQVGVRVVDPLQVGLFVSGKEGDPPTLEAESYPATALVSQKKGWPFMLSLNAGYVSCTETSLTAELTGSATEVQLDPSYGGCNALGFAGATIDMNSCHYVVSLLDVGPPYAGSAEIACDQEGDAIEIVAGIFCRVTIPEQQGLEGIDIANVGQGHKRELDVDAALTGIEYTEEDLFLGICNNGAFTNGVAQAQDAKVKGF